MVSLSAKTVIKERAENIAACSQALEHNLISLNGLPTYKICFLKSFLLDTDLVYLVHDVANWQPSMLAQDNMDII